MIVSVSNLRCRRVAVAVIMERKKRSFGGFRCFCVAALFAAAALACGRAEAAPSISTSTDIFAAGYDISVLKKSFGKSAGQTGYDIDADFNGDGVVSISDAGVLKANFGTSVDVITPSPCATP